MANTARYCFICQRKHVRSNTVVIITLLCLLRSCSAQCILHCIVYFSMAYCPLLKDTVNLHVTTKSLGTKAQRQRNKHPSCKAVKCFLAHLRVSQPLISTPYLPVLELTSDGKAKFFMDTNYELMSHKGYFALKCLFALFFYVYCISPWHLVILCFT